MKHSVITIFVLSYYYSYCCFCHIFVIQRTEQINLCQKDWRKSSILLPLKTANTETVLKRSILNSRFKTKTNKKSRIWMSCNSKYHHRQWWQKKIRNSNRKAKSGLCTGNKSKSAKPFPSCIYIYFIIYCYYYYFCLLTGNHGGKKSVC